MPDGVHRVIELARQAAGDRYVTIGGGADIARQFLAAGLVDELQLHVVPKLLGEGVAAVRRPRRAAVDAVADQDPGGRLAGRHPPAVPGDEPVARAADE